MEPRLIRHKGAICVVVERSPIFETSSIFKDVRRRGDLIVFNRETARLDVVKASSEIFYTDTATGQIIELSRSVEEAHRFLRSNGYKDGVIVCERAQFSTYYTGAITGFMRTLWNRAGKEYR